MLHIFLTAWLIIYSFLYLYGSEFDSGYNHSTGRGIDRLKVCGERCSGTNYLFYLLHANFPSLSQTDLLEFGHKHFMWWFGTSLDETKLNKLKYTQRAVYLNGSQNCLFVVVIREPYDWLRSFYLTPHFVHNDLLKHSFFHFISSQWKLTPLYESYDGHYDEIDNYNPWTGQPFSNILELRKHKIQNYLALGSLVKHYIIVRYEDVRDHPEGFIHYVSSLCGLVKTSRVYSHHNS